MIPIFQNLLQNLQTFFAGPVALSGSLIATVVSGVTMAHGDHDSKRKIAPLLIGSGLALGASVICSWIQSQG